MTWLMGIGIDPKAEVREVCDLIINDLYTPEVAKSWWDTRMSALRMRTPNETLELGKYMMLYQYVQRIQKLSKRIKKMGDKKWRNQE